MKPAIFAALVMALFAAFAAIPPMRPSDHDGRKTVPTIVFKDEKGATVDLSGFRGKVVLLDFWATWCVPCRKEMPSLDRLQERLGAKGLVVVPVAIDAKGMPAVEDFYRELDIRRLAKYADDTRESAAAIGLTGVPATIALDRQGREAFRVEGALDWNGLAVTTRLETLLNE
jgi:thiol-disulfide isomerase/thioredoxin